MKLSLLEACVNERREDGQREGRKRRKDGWRGIKGRRGKEWRKRGRIREGREGGREGRKKERKEERTTGEETS